MVFTNCGPRPLDVNEDDGTEEEEGGLDEVKVGDAVTTTGGEVAVNDDDGGG